MDQKFIFRLILLVVFTLVFSSCHKEETQIKTLLGTSVSKEKVDAFIDEQMQALNMPGLSIAIINEGEVVYHRVKGYANKERQILADSTTLFEGASISKSVFGFFAMTFVEEGLLDLDKPLYEYLPNPAIEHDERYKKITARIVLSHRSGFPNWRDDYPEKELFIQFEPGTAYHYSGEGYQYLAEVLKHLLKTNWAGLEAEFQKRVAIPFGLEYTVFIKNDYTRKYKAQPYDVDGNWIDKSKSEWWTSRDSVFVAPTTIHSEAIDFSKWMIAMMQEEGLSKEGFAELYRPHSEIVSGLLQEDYTLGFTRLSVLGLSELYTHSGNNDGFSSYFAFDKEKEWGFVVFTNSSRLGDQFAQNLTYRLLLSGSVPKLAAIVLCTLFAALLLITNLILVFFKSRRRVIRGANLRIGLLAFSSCLLSLVLMLLGHSGIVNYLYGIGLLLTVYWGWNVLRKIQLNWREERSARVELCVQCFLLAGVLLSGVAVGLLE